MNIISKGKALQNSGIQFDLQERAHAMRSIPGSTDTQNFEGGMLLAKHYSLEIKNEDNMNN